MGKEHVAEKLTSGEPGEMPTDEALVFLRGDVDRLVKKLVGLLIAGNLHTFALEVRLKLSFFESSLTL